MGMKKNSKEEDVKGYLKDYITKGTSRYKDPRVTYLAVNIRLPIKKAMFMKRLNRFSLAIRQGLSFEVAVMEYFPAKPLAIPNKQLSSQTELPTPDKQLGTIVDIAQYALDCVLSLDELVKLCKKDHDFIFTELCHYNLHVLEPDNEGERKTLNRLRKLSGMPVMRKMRPKTINKLKLINERDELAEKLRGIEDIKDKKKYITKKFGITAAKVIPKNMTKLATLVIAIKHGVSEFTVEDYEKDVGVVYIEGRKYCVLKSSSIFKTNKNSMPSK